MDSNEERDAIVETDGGFVFAGFKRTGEDVVQLHVDDYGNGVVGVYNRKGKGRKVEPGP